MEVSEASAWSKERVLCPRLGGSQMSGLVQLWSQQTGGTKTSIEGLFEPIALEARLAEARSRRAQALAAKYRDRPAPTADASTHVALSLAAKSRTLGLASFLSGVAAA